MEDVISWLNKYFFELIVGLSVLAVLAATSKMWQGIKNADETKQIIGFLESSDKKFRSTHAISSHTNLTEDRVRALCSNTEKIRRNEKEKESWTLR